MSSGPQDTWSELPSLISAICQRPRTVILFLVLSLQSTQQRPLSPLIPTQILHKYAEAFCRIYLKGKSDGIPWSVEPDELLRQVDL